MRAIANYLLKIDNRRDSKGGEFEGKVHSVKKASYCHSKKGRRLWKECILLDGEGSC
jgi:hypothetical protein